MADSRQPGKAQRLSIRLMGLQPGASQDEMVAALQRLYRGKTEDDVRKAIARLPLVLTRSVTEDQARKIRNLLEAKGAILEIAYESTGPVRVPEPTPPPSEEAPAAPVPSGVPGRPPCRERRARPRIHMGIQLEPMEVGEILDRAFRLLRERFWTYLLIMVIPLAIAALATGVMAVVFGSMLGGIVFGQGPSLGSIFGLVLVGCIVLCVFLAAQAWSQGALVHAVSENYLGHETGVKAAYAATLSMLLRLVGTILLLGILLILVTVGAFLVASALFFLGRALGGGILNLFFGLIGALVFVVPGFWLLMNWLLADKVVVLEGLGGWQALTRSKELMSTRTEPGFWKGPKVKVTVLTLVAGIIAIGILLIFQAPKILVGFVWPGSVLLLTSLQLLYIVGNALATTYWAISMILYYYDIRIRKEGFDLKMMADNL